MKHLLSVLFCTCFSIYLNAQQSVEWGNWKIGVIKGTEPT